MSSGGKIGHLSWCGEKRRAREGVLSAARWACASSGSVARLIASVSARSAHTTANAEKLRGMIHGRFPAREADFTLASFPARDERAAHEADTRLLSALCSRPTANAGTRRPESSGEAALSGAAASVESRAVRFLHTREYLEVQFDVDLSVAKGATEIEDAFELSRGHKRARRPV